MKLVKILELPDNITIYSNRFSWVLDSGDKNNRSYYSYLDELCDSLLDERLHQKLLGLEEKKLITSLIDAVGDAREAVRNDLERLKEIMTNADRAREKGDFDAGIHG